MESESISFAREAYDAYGATTDHKNYQGLPMPKWDDLPEKIRTAWVAAAERVAKLARAA
jgi:hypothetical protein